MAVKQNHRIVYPVLSILFPCLLGMVGMIHGNVSGSIWMQNAAAILLLSVVCYGLSKIQISFNARLVVPVSVLLLGLTFAGPNLDGVRRWIKIPLFSFNVAMIVMPITIAAFYRLVEEKQYVLALTGAIVIALILFWQPDASQLLAFSLPIMVLFIKSKLPKGITIGLSMILLLLSAKSWIKLDHLQPVNYTEGILTMVSDVSNVLSVAGIVSLLWIPVCFLVLCRKQSRKICVGIMIYDWVMIISSFSGHFPVPFMGYGISPILGFYVFLIWFLNEFDRESSIESSVSSNLHV